MVSTCLACELQRWEAQRPSVSISRCGARARPFDRDIILSSWRDLQWGNEWIRFYQSSKPASGTALIQVAHLLACHKNVLAFVGANDSGRIGRAQDCHCRAHTRRASKPHSFHSLARRCRVRRYWQYWPRAGPCNGDGLRPVHVTLWFKECHLARLSSHCWYGRACGCRITMTTMEAGGPNRMKNAGRSNVVAHLFVNKHRDPLFYYWRSTGQINLKRLQQIQI